MQESGVEIYRRFYPWPGRYRLGDPVLVKEVTGMTWPQFAAALDEQEQAYEEARESGQEAPEPDQVVLAGLIAVAFWQGNPHMTREKARRSLERIPLEDIEVVQGDDVDPPAVNGAGEPPVPTSSESVAPPEAPDSTETTPASTWAETSLNPSGLPG